VHTFAPSSPGSSSPFGVSGVMAPRFKADHWKVIRPTIAATPRSPREHAIQESAEALDGRLQDLDLRPAGTGCGRREDNELPRWLGRP
jgi:hypothetical protein